MRLTELAEEVKGSRIVGDGDPEVSAISPDSRSVGPGFVFAAIQGASDDGGRYVADAVARGAVAVLASASRLFENLSVPVLAVPDPRPALGEAADALYRHPARSLSLAGVTGTNGKTSTAYILRHILKQAGLPCGMLGTIEYDNGAKVEVSPLTTPDAALFTRSLAEMRDNGCKAAVVEVSSHALSQFRVWPHRFAFAIFTNLTRDHLDYHGDMDKYLAAKRILFENLDAEASAVLNLDDPRARAVGKGIAARVCGYTLESDRRPSDQVARVEIVSTGLAGQKLRIEGCGIDGVVETGLIGRHNAANLMGAILAAVRMGVDFRLVAGACESFPGVPGRLERLDSPKGAAVFVDYAHTDDAIASVLSILQPLTPGRIISVFGCGGDRDRGKRPLMARAAESGSDQVIVTSDNPRTEDPDRIFADIMPGFANPGAVEVIPDRAAAIARAVALAGVGDAVLVAGKGHEDYQIIGKTKIHLDDRELVRDAFDKVESGPGDGREGIGS